MALRFYAICLAALGAAVGLTFSVPLASGTDGALQATVTVVTPDPFTYGFAVHSCSHCLNSEKALGQADGEGAFVLHNGEIILDVGQVAIDCRLVSVWAKSIGWGPSHLRLYISEDGRKWKHVGNANPTSEYARFLFEDNLGTVRYLRVVRGGWMFGALVLDAVGAGGGGR